MEYSVLDLTTGTVKKYKFDSTVSADHEEISKKVDKMTPRIITTVLSDVIGAGTATNVG